jgi:cell shape-determining protein MreC
MKMNYLRDRGFAPRARDDWKRPVLLVVLVVGLYAFGSGLFVDLFSVVTYPLERLSGQVTDSWNDALKSRQALIAENKRLMAENERLQVGAARAAELAAANDQLRGLKAEAGGGGKIFAKVLVKPNHLPYDEMIIDLGTERDPNLAPGQLVFAADQTVIGQIDQVSSRSAKIRLYSEAGVSLPVAVGAAAYPGVALGAGGGNFFLSLPRGLDIKVGDPIKTTIVGDYLLGYAAKIDKNPNDPFQKIQFRSPFNIFGLTWVFINRETK